MRDRSRTSGSVVTALLAFVFAAAAATNAASLFSEEHRILAILSALFALAFLVVGWLTRNGRRDPLIFLFCCYSTFAAATRVMVYLQDRKNLLAALFAATAMVLLACSVTVGLELSRHRGNKLHSESGS